MNSTTPRQPGRETSGHTGAGLIGDLRTGIDAGREAREATERAYEREATRGSQDDADGDADSSLPLGSGASASGGFDRRDTGGVDSGILASNAPAGSLAGTSGGERASAGINDANRSSRDHGNSLDD